MAASVRIEDEAFVDPRVELLGQIAGYNRFEALGRLAHLWRACTHRETYTLPTVVIVACLGDKGPEAIVGADLGEKVEGGIRVKGTHGRIEWLKARREAARAGGQANKSRVKAGAEPKGSRRKRGGSATKPKPTLEASQTGANGEPNHTPPTPTPTPTPDLPSEEEDPPQPPADAGGGRTTPDPRTVPIPAELDTPAFREAWERYVAHRQGMSKSKRLTLNGAELALKKLAPFGAERAAALAERAVMNGWQGILFDEKPGGAPGVRLHQPGGKSSSDIEREMAERAAKVQRLYEEEQARKAG